jgi:hypothetical protein
MCRELHIKPDNEVRFHLLEGVRNGFSKPSHPDTSDHLRALEVSWMVKATQLPARGVGFFFSALR